MLLRIRNMMPMGGGLLLAMAIGGCSSDQAIRQPNLDFDYLDVPADIVLEIPPGLAKPAATGDYVIPPAGNVDAGYTGARVDIRPPVQVMSLLAIKQVDTDGERIVVTIAADGDPASQRVALWDGVLAYLTDSGAGIADWDISSYRVDSGWVDVRRRSGSWFNRTQPLQRQYRFQVLPPDTKGNLRLSVQQLAERHPDRSNSTVSGAALVEQQRNAKLMLNQLIVYYDEKRQQNAPVRIRSEHLTRLRFGSDSNNLPAWLADTPFEDVWREFPLLLERMNFRVTALNAAQGVISASYTNMNQRQFDALDVEPFELDGSKFSFQLGDLGESTSITMFAQNGKPVKAESMAKLYPAMQSVLRQGL